MAAYQLERGLATDRFRLASAAMERLYVDLNMDIHSLESKGRRVRLDLDEVRRQLSAQNVMMEMMNEKLARLQKLLAEARGEEYPADPPSKMRRLSLQEDPEGEAAGSSGPVAG